MPSKTPLRRRITPSVPFQLHVEDESGTQVLSFKISFDMNAFTAFEEVTGLSMLTDIKEVFDRPTAGTTTAMLWAGIAEHHPEYADVEGLKALRSLVTFSQLRPALTACSEAFLTQLPKDKQDELRARKAAIEAGQEPAPLASAQAMEKAAQ